MINSSSSNTDFSQAHILIEIESLVKSIAADSLQHFVDAKAYQHIMVCLPRYLSVYHSGYDYSEHIEAFWIGCEAAGILGSTALITTEQVFVLVQSIEQHVKSLSFKRQVTDRLYQAKQKNQRIRKYARALHEHYARLLVVRVDLYYRKDCCHVISIDDVYRHSRMMITARKISRDLFQHEVGHIRVIEQGGKSRGYHIHIASYFLGSRNHSGFYMAKQIGELWMSVTSNMGTYHSCHTNEKKAKYERMGTLGVGMIYRSDPDACTRSIEAVTYLADVDKDDQYLRMKPKGTRTFVTGILSKGHRQCKNDPVAPFQIAPRSN